MRKVLETGLAVVAPVIGRHASRQNKDNKTVLIIPRRGDTFTGNSKYFFCYLVAQGQSCGVKPYLLMKNSVIYRELKSMGAPVLAYPSLEAFRIMRAAGTTIVENTMWGRGLRAPFVAGSRLYQVWHGTGIKNVGADDPRIARRKGRSALGRFRAAVTGTNVPFDVMVFSSKAHMEGRKHAFQFKDYFINGQPRNDVVFGAFEGNALAELGTDQPALDRIKAARAEGKKVILYTPTWRKKSADQPESFFDWGALEEFAKAQNAIVIVKPHPKDKDYAQPSDVIVPYTAAKDVYHAFPYVDVMISDFSSIFMDFLLTDKPLVFFQPDRDAFTSDRGFQFDIDEILPGPIVHDQKAMHAELTKALNADIDPYSEFRQRTLSEFCRYRDGQSCRRLMEHIKNEASAA